MEVSLMTNEQKLMAALRERIAQIKKDKSAFRMSEYVEAEVAPKPKPEPKQPLPEATVVKQKGCLDGVEASIDAIVKCAEDQYKSLAATCEEALSNSTNLVHALTKANAENLELVALLENETGKKVIQRSDGTIYLK
jgi:hypothetical protein